MSAVSQIVVFVALILCFLHLIAFTFDLYPEIDTQSSDSWYWNYIATFGQQLPANLSHVEWRLLKWRMTSQEFNFYITALAIMFFINMIYALFLHKTLIRRIQRVVYVVSVPAFRSARRGRLRQTKSSSSERQSVVEPSEQSDADEVECYDQCSSDLVSTSNKAERRELRTDLDNAATDVDPAMMDNIQRSAEKISVIRPEMAVTMLDQCGQFKQQCCPKGFRPPFGANGPSASLHEKLIREIQAGVQLRATKSPPCSK